MKSLSDLLNQVPPAVVRLLATNGKRPLTDKELSHLSGLSVSTIKRMSRMQSWPVDKVSRFLQACGVNPFQLKKYRRILNSKKGLAGLKHLNSKGPIWQKRSQRAQVKRLIRTLS